MTRIADALERESRTVDLEQGDFERLLGRRERKQRNRRIGAGAVGVIVALATATVLARSLAAERVPADRLVPPAAAGTLAYVLDGDVYVANQDGSNAVRIADGRSAKDCYGWSGEYWAEGPMWSPDGRYVAYRRYPDCGSDESPVRPLDVVISDAAGNVVAEFPARGWRIAWSPDSARVAVWDSWGSESGFTIGVYGLDGSRQTQLTMPSGWEPPGDTDPRWMPEGTSVRVGDVEVPLDGGELRPFDPNNWPNCSPFSEDVCSADGSRAAAVVDDGSLTVARPDGSGSVTLVAGERGVDLMDIGFSPEGDRILFSKTDSRASADRPQSLWSIGVDGSAPRLVVAGTTQGEWLSVAKSQTADTVEPDPSAEVDPSPAPAGTLAYITLAGDVYVAEPDGSNARMIADGRPGEDCADRPEYWIEPTFTFWRQASMWSPDGRYLAYRYSDCSSLEDWQEGVVISDAGGNVIARFPTGRGWQIAWSPDSTRVAVWDVLPKTIGIYGLDGVRQTQLEVRVLPGSDVSGDIDPMWTPDGNSLVLGNTELPLDGGTPRLLPRWFGAYSPDGSQVMYGANGGSLMVSRADGSEAREVIRDASSATWSPTGERIAFITGRSGELRVIELATRSVRTLLAEPGSELGVIGFSPRGDRILFSMPKDGQPSLWSIGLDGSDPRLVVAGTTLGEWRPR